MKNEEISARISQHFGDARVALDDAVKAIIGRQAAAKMLMSGGTVKQILRASSERTLAAVDLSLADIGRAMDIRGGDRKKFTLLLRQALPQHLGSIKASVTGDLERVKAPASSVSKAFQVMHSAVDRRISEFETGWTAPTLKSWRDRHRLVYDVLLIAAGASTTLLVTWIASVLNLSKN